MLISDFASFTERTAMGRQGRQGSATFSPSKDNRQCHLRKRRHLFALPCPRLPQNASIDSGQRQGQVGREWRSRDASASLGFPIAHMISRTLSRPIGF
jgi:hypothetical protein